MFNKLKDVFKGTQEKAENAIDDVAKTTKDLMDNANQLVDESKDKLKVAVVIGMASIALNVLANIVTIYSCSKVIKSVNKNDVLNEIAKMLRNNK